MTETDPREPLMALRAEVGKAVVGQDAAITGLVIALLCRGHVLLEGVPGTAKTLMVRALAASLSLDHKRVQFTPDLMPGDVTGSLVYDNRTSAFSFRPGPIFTNLLLADEINRTPPKTQASLLEVMEEGQVTIDGIARPLPDPFLVAATQNPIEYEGTYPLPEAQLDRFLLMLSVPLPERTPSSACWPGTWRASTRATCRRGRASGRDADDLSEPGRPWPRWGSPPRSRRTSSTSCAPPAPRLRAIGRVPRGAIAVLRTARAGLARGARLRDPG